MTWCNRVATTSLMYLLFSGPVIAADEALERQIGELPVPFQTTQEAIDATTVVWQSRIVGRQHAPAAAEMPTELRKAEVLSDRGKTRQVKISWQRIELQLPPATENLARKANGAEFSASSVSGQLLLGTEPDPNTPAAIQVRWRDATVGRYPDWVVARFPQPRQIGTVVLRTFGEHVRGRNKEGIRSYELQYAGPKETWITVATVKDNIKEWLIHQFPAISTQAVRLLVTEGNTHDEIGWRVLPFYSEHSPNGNFSRLQDFQVFNLGKKPIYRVCDVSRDVSIEKAALGRVAIFKDDVPMPEGVASSPDYLAQVLRQAGFSVTFLDAELLSNSSILSKENFDLFVQPYGCCFPLGTTLYQFLESGGHLVTLGGYAFTNALVRSPDGKLLASGYDPGIITSPAKMVQLDWYAPLREMLGIFAGVNQRFKHVAVTRPAPGQFLADASLRIEGPLLGYPATGLVGQTISDDEETKLAQEGKEWDQYAKIRPGLRDFSRRNFGENHGLPDYYAFNAACARWEPLLETFDRYNRPRGSAGALLLNHDGRYRGSTWAFFGATNRDLFAHDNPRMAQLLVNVVNHSIRATYLHGLNPGYYCYRQDEEVSAQIFAANFGRVDRNGRVIFSFLPLRDEKPVFTKQSEVRIPKGGSTPIEVCWSPGSFPLDFYRIRCLLELDGKPVDQMESGIVVWNEKAIQSDDAFHVKFHDNYFYDGDRPLLINGTRADGLPRVGQAGENPLAWEREYRMLQEFGLSVTSPVYVTTHVSGLGWGTEQPGLIPERILRQLDAQVQLCQRHKIIYAPCVFFENKSLAATNKRDLARRICALLGERYGKVPGIVFYLWDDGNQLADATCKAFDAYTKGCVAGFSKNREKRNYITLAEVKDSEKIATRRTFAHLTVANFWGSGPWDILHSRMADQRAAGKSQSQGEFFWWACGGEDSANRYYLAYPHTVFALGYSWVLNWVWRDPDHAIMPWGVVYPCDHIPKDCLYAYRNESWFFRSFRPKYVQPELMFVLPEFYWDKSEHVQGAPENCRGVDAKLLTEMSKLIELGYIDLGVIDDWDLDKLAPHTKALVYPVAFCPDDKTYQRVRDFVKRGGHLYLTGDISYGPNEGRRRPERLAELAGVVPAEPLLETKAPRSLAAVGRAETIKPTGAVPGWNEPYSGRVALRLAAKDADVIATDATGAPVVTRHKLGKGSVLFNADVSAAAPPILLHSFLEQAGVQRHRAEPDDPSVVRVYHLSVEGGQVFGLSVRGARRLFPMTEFSLWKRMTRNGSTRSPPRPRRSH